MVHNPAWMGAACMHCGGWRHFNGQTGQDRSCANQCACRERH